MPLYQLIEKNENIAKRNFFEFACFLTGLIDIGNKGMQISLLIKTTIKSLFF
jgi:hypothetical protein